MFARDSAGLADDDVEQAADDITGSGDALKDAVLGDLCRGDRHIAATVTGPRGSSGPGCGSWFVVDGRAGVGCWGCRVQRVGAVPLLVELVARGDRFTAVDGSLLLQTGGLCRVHIRFGCGGAGFGGGLVGEGFL